MRPVTAQAHLAGLVLALVLGGACRPAERSPAGPVTVMDDAGRAVTLDSAARRVVSLLPSFTELLFAIGSGDRIVGRTTWCDWPPEARRIPSVGDGLPPNIEAVAAQRPDLVVLYRSGPNVTAAEQLERLGIRTTLFDLNRLEDLGPVARRLGVLTGRTTHGDSLAAALDSLATASVPEPLSPGPRSLVFVVWDNPPIVIGAGSYLDQLAALAGARNVFHDVATPSAQVSIETIAARDPDVVAVLADTAKQPAWAGRREWRSVRAVREGRFLYMPGTLFGRPGPRAAEAVRELRQRLARVGAAP
jgi:ABC-type Fe3+-hydroxamate transport system substrate-binding protein